MSYYLFKLSHAVTERVFVFVLPTNFVCGFILPENSINSISKNIFRSNFYGWKNVLYLENSIVFFSKHMKCIADNKSLVDGEKKLKHSTINTPNKFNFLSSIKFIYYFE